MLADMSSSVRSGAPAAAASAGAARRCSRTLNGHGRTSGWTCSWRPALSQATSTAPSASGSARLAAGPSQAPGAVASRVVQPAVLGPGAPVQPGDHRRLAVRRSPCRTARTSSCGWCGRSGAKLFVSGAINRAEVMAAFAAAGHPGPGPAPWPRRRRPPARCPAGCSSCILRARPSPSSPSVARARRARRPDYFAAEMMASILAGDSISSRIGQNVREMRGYAYSLGGGFGYCPGRRQLLRSRRRCAPTSPARACSRCWRRSASCASPG